MEARECRELTKAERRELEDHLKWKN